MSFTGKQSRLRSAQGKMIKDKTRIKDIIRYGDNYRTVGLYNTMYSVPKHKKQLGIVTVRLDTCEKSWISLIYLCCDLQFVSTVQIKYILKSL